MLGLRYCTLGVYPNLIQKFKIGLIVFSLLLLVEHAFGVTLMPYNMSHQTATHAEMQMDHDMDHSTMHESTSEHDCCDEDNCCDGMCAAVYLASVPWASATAFLNTQTPLQLRQYTVQLALPAIPPVLS